MKNSIRTNPERLGEKLFKIRNRLGLSQTEILEKLGFQERLFRSNISQYERGDREPPLLVLLSYARLADTTIDTLVDDDLELPDSLALKGGESLQ